MDNFILEMKNITKLFPGVKALDNVNLKVKSGTIHALIGENGAGKSTLMNVLSGIYQYGTYDGDIIFQGEKCCFRNIKDSEKIGIGIIHQELALIPYLSIGENIFLGITPSLPIAKSNRAAPTCPAIPLPKQAINKTIAMALNRNCPPTLAETSKKAVSGFTNEL